MFIVQKYQEAAVYSHAKSSSAKRFLLDIVKQAPFCIESIQVDGGLEFMAEFEDACEELNIPLIVLRIQHAFSETASLSHFI